MANDENDAVLKLIENFTLIFMSLLSKKCLKKLIKIRVKLKAIAHEERYR